jgi:AraC family transcriptional regulator
MKVDVVEPAPLHLASVRHVGSYMRIPEAFRRLHDIATAAGLSKPETMLLGIYHDDPSTTPEEQLRSDAAITVPENTKLPRGLTELVIPAGRYAHSVYRGPYTGLGQVWDHLRTTWLPRSGEKAGTGFSYEVYRNTPVNAKPEDLVTDVYLSLA